MIQKSLVQYNQREGENDDKSGVEDAKLWLQSKPQFKLRSTGVCADAKRCFDSSQTIQTPFKALWYIVF